jgi:hypothetical protein
LTTSVLDRSKCSLSKTDFLGIRDLSIPLSMEFL